MRRVRPAALSVQLPAGGCRIAGVVRRSNCHRSLGLLRTLRRCGLGRRRGSVVRGCLVGFVDAGTADAFRDVGADLWADVRGGEGAELFAGALGGGLRSGCSSEPVLPTRRRGSVRLPCGGGCCGHRRGVVGAGGGFGRGCGVYRRPNPPGTSRLRSCA